MTDRTNRVGFIRDNRNLWFVYLDGIEIGRLERTELYRPRGHTWDFHAYRGLALFNFPRLDIARACVTGVLERGQSLDGFDTDPGDEDDWKRGGAR